MRERVLAVVGAIALVVVALLVRSAVAGSDDDRPKAPKGNGGGDLPVVACTPELDEVCDQLADAGRIAPNPPTLDLSKASDPPDDVDGWITWDPAPQIAGFASPQAKPDAVWTSSTELGAATIGVLAAPAAIEELEQSCDAVDWECVAIEGDQRLSVGVGRASTAEGLARLLPLALALSDDADFQQTDQRQLRVLLASPVGGQADARSMAVARVTRQGEADVVVGPTPLLEHQAATAGGQAKRLEVIEPDPNAEVTVVVASRVGRDLGEVDGWCEDAADALEQVGVEPCTGEPDDALAGFLFQIKKRVS